MKKAYSKPNIVSIGRKVADIYLPMPLPDFIKLSKCMGKAFPGCRIANSNTGYSIFAPTK
jgi:hypothetical protein